MSVSVYRRGGDPLDWNVANANFVGIMELIGHPVIPNDLAGEWDLPALTILRERIEFAIASLRAMPELDGGSPTVELPREPDQCRVIACGHRPGYYLDRLSGLLGIVNRAIEAGESVYYG